MKNLLKNRAIFTIIILLYFNLSYSQNWEWATAGTKSLADDNGVIAIDKNNDIYLASAYDAIKAYIINGEYFNQYAFCKFNSNGVLQWVKEITNRENCDPSTFKLQVASNKQISGAYFCGTVCGKGKFDTLSYNTNLSQQLFIAKYNSNGICLWRKVFGNSSTTLTSICADINGNVYLLGECNTFIIDNYTVSAGTYIVKLDSNGVVIFSKTIRKYSDLGCTVKSLICDKNENLAITGFISTKYNSFTLDSVITSSTNVKYYISKLDRNGKLIWIKTDGNGKSVGVGKMQFDENANIYITGLFQDTLTIGTTVLMPHYGIPGEYPENIKIIEIFLLKYDSSGNLKWVKYSTQSSKNVSVLDIAVTNNSIYITGCHRGITTFDNNTVNASTTDGVSMYVVHYDSSGACIGVKDVDNIVRYSIQGDPSISIALDTNEDCIVAGQFSGGQVVYTTYFDSYALTSMGGRDVFIAKCPAITGIETIIRALSLPSNNLIIYANPTTGKCNITLPTEFENETNLTIQILDINGKLLQNANIEMDNNTIKVDIEQEAKGIYNVILSNGVNSYKGKIVFE